MNLLKNEIILTHTFDFHGFLRQGRGALAGLMPCCHIVPSIKKHFRLLHHGSFAFLSVVGSESSLSCDIFVT